MEKAPSKLNSSGALDPTAPTVGDTAWSSVLIIEGTSGLGKSTLIDQLVRRYVADRPARKLRTLLHLTQAHTYVPVAVDEDRKTLVSLIGNSALYRLLTSNRYQVGVAECRAFDNHTKRRYGGMIRRAGHI